MGSMAKNSNSDSSSLDAPESVSSRSRAIECEVVDGQHRIRNLMPQARDIDILPSPEGQLEHCIEHDTKAYNELIATTFEAHRNCKTYETQFEAAKLIMVMLQKRREMMLQPTKRELPKTKVPRGIGYDSGQEANDKSGVSGLN